MARAKEQRNSRRAEKWRKRERKERPSEGIRKVVRTTLEVVGGEGGEIGSRRLPRADFPFETSSRTKRNAKEKSREGKFNFLVGKGKQTPADLRSGSRC